MTILRSVSPRNSGSPDRGRRSRSLSRPRRSRSRSINGAGVASNPGDNLYITGLSTVITSSDLEKYFNWIKREGSSYISGFGKEILNSGWLWILKILM
ncbi:PREDICTED: serine/arginine-rich splicing factor SR45a-like [Populus euphratica]|uniref:Serine/arginine-rich splicing factor SR45a-like n=1 Tax=Populus euphratica TaxID=75702 RepID=A0AAJ6XSK5_POPEU|nr:PREDICTED: serine/arginine-rich splicing factor SR45a-like [Populus euphratica]